MTLNFRLAGASALLAAVSMAVTPAAAAEHSSGAAHVSAPVFAVWDSGSVNADQYRRYHRRDRGIDAGDVLAGVLIIGGIAAVASAASNASRNRDYRNRDYPYRGGDYRDRPYQYRPYRGDSRYADSRGIDRAVDMCVQAVERNVRVQSVDSVDRLGEGWRVAGSIYNGDGFTCRIGNGGQVEDVDYGARAWDGADAGPGQDRQWGSDVYEQARRSQDAQPAYPGGPAGDSDYEN